jgi:hypothetical protein
LFYDIEQKRWGKLRIDHVDCLQFPYPNLIGQVSFPLPLASVAFLQSDGTVQLLVQDDRVSIDQGVCIMGRFQLVREKMVTFDKVEVETLLQAFPPSAYLCVSPDGKALGTPQALTVLSDSGNRKLYGAPAPNSAGTAAQRTGKNFSLMLVGTFELSTAVFTILGRTGNR